MNLLKSIWEFPGGSDGKESACNMRDPGLIPGLGRSPGEGNGYPLQYHCLEDSVDRGAWQAAVHMVSKSQTRLSDQKKKETVVLLKVVIEFFHSCRFISERNKTYSLICSSL